MLPLALVACGGGGGSGGGTSGGVPVVAAPTPTPSPVATATPTPSYALAFDFTRDRSFEAIGTDARYIFESASSPPRSRDIVTRLIDDAAGLRIDYVAAREETTLGAGLRTPDTYPGSLITSRSTGGFTYTRDDGTLGITRPGQNFGFPFAFEYVAAVIQEASSRAAPDTNILSRRLLIGTPTVEGDVPTGGSLSYLASLNASVLQTAGFTGFTVNDDPRVSVDFAANTVNAAIAARRTRSDGTVENATFTLNGRLDRTNNRLSGTVALSNGGAGTFVGRLYGPRGAELGVSFTVLRGDERLVGLVLAKLPPATSPA